MTVVLRPPTGRKTGTPSTVLKLYTFFASPSL